MSYQRDDINAPVYGVNRDFDLSRPIYDRHLDDDELLSDFADAAGDRRLKDSQDDFRPTFKPTQPHIPLATQPTLNEQEDYDSELDEIDYLNLTKPTTYNGHFAENESTIPEKKRREPLGEREMRLQRKLEELRNRHRMRNMKNGEEAVRKYRQEMGIIGFTDRLAEVDDLKYFGQGGGLASYYTDTLIQRVKGEIVKKGVDSQIAKINQNKYSFYELVRLRRDIRKPPQVDSQRIEVVGGGGLEKSIMKPNHMVIKGDYTYHSRNPQGGAAAASGMNQKYQTFQQKMAVGTKPRTIYDPNKPFQDGGPYSDQSSYYIFPKLPAKEQSHHVHQQQTNFSKIPIKRHTERLPSLLYHGLDETLEYYNDRIKEERFLALHSGPLGTKMTLGGHIGMPASRIRSETRYATVQDSVII